jgi:hypothetical protein
MKNWKQFTFAAILLLIGGLFYVNAQDMIVLKDGNMIEAKVMEISPTEIRYKRFDHLDGPTIVVLISNVLSIRYENGKVDIFNKVSALEQSSPQGNASLEGNASPQLNQPTALQSILNALPAIPIAGNNLKFEFGGESWLARVNGENFSAGTIEFEETAEGGIITLRQTHIWPGAVGKTAGRIVNVIPGGGAVGGVLTAAGNVAGALGPIETSGTIVLEYKAGPPAKLSFVKSASGGKEAVEKKARPSGPERLNTIGFSLGSAFAAPLFLGTVRGTVAPGPYTFFEFGIDMGGGSGDQADGYFSWGPYSHFALFLPFGEKGGWYAGAGAGLTLSNYIIFDDYHSGDSNFTFNLVTGFNFWNVLDISYTLRMNSVSANSKITAGLTYRFK